MYIPHCFVLYSILPNLARMFEVVFTKFFVLFAPPFGKNVQKVNKARAWRAGLAALFQFRVRSPSLTQPSFLHTALRSGHRIAGRTKLMSTRPSQSKPVG